MYTYLFKNFYVFFKSRKNPEAVFNSSLLVFLAQGIHFFLLYALVENIFEFRIVELISERKSVSKIYFLPFVFIWMFLVERYFKNKSNHIKDIEFNKTMNIYQFLILLFSVLVLPLYIVIKLSGGEIWK